MSETARTAAYVAAAAILAALAFLWAPAEKVPPVFSDQGEPFFPDFQDPVGTPEDPAVTSMEVIDFDGSTASARPFRVEFRDGLWRIPSHHDYPADASDRLARTAAGVVGLRKDRVVSDRTRDHGPLGVIDPLTDASGPLEGRGRRVTLGAADGRVLADFIVGKAVEGSPGMRYVRLPDGKRTYAVKVDVDLSARFGDWIETDLLRIDRTRLREIVLDGYSVDEASGTLKPGDVLTLGRPESGGDWSLEGAGPDEGPDQAKVRTILDTLDDLRIVGVRRKPGGLSRDLRAEEGMRLDSAGLLSLQRAGYFLTRDGRLVSNEGEVRARTGDGVVYTLRFGEVLFGSGDDVTAGGGDEEGEPPAGGAENRYLFVTADFDEAALGPAPGAEGTAATGPEEGPDAPEPPPSGAESVEDGRGAAGAIEEHRKKVEEGRKKAREQNDRFAAWYYVIPAESFRKLRLSRGDLLASPPAGTGAEPGKGTGVVPGEGPAPPAPGEGGDERGDDEGGGVPDDGGGDGERR